ncbi:MAG: hypothetical protein GY859_00750 [Desulfobacterales bacterium]|nr:hypothetical protein [Desulfobacterales bacterium]
MKEKCLNNLRKMVVGLPGGAGAEDLLSSDLQTFYKSIAERPFPLPFIFTRGPMFKRLLWRPEDFRPEIRSILEKEVAAGWRAMRAGAETSEETPLLEEDREEDRGGDRGGDEAPMGEEEADVAPAFREKAAGERSEPVALTASAPKEDLFDRFVGWVAALVSC